MLFSRPTYIQTCAIPELLSRRTSLVAAETGNGKTLAFLAPVLHQILALKEATECERNRPGCPLAIVVAPSK